VASVCSEGDQLNRTVLQETGGVIEGQCWRGGRAGLSRAEGPRIARSTDRGICKAHVQRGTSGCSCRCEASDWGGEGRNLGGRCGRASVCIGSCCRDRVGDRSSRTALEQVGNGGGVDRVQRRGG